jgi:hypothetical protein
MPIEPARYRRTAIAGRRPPPGAGGPIMTDVRAQQNQAGDPADATGPSNAGIEAGHLALGHALITMVEPDRETVSAYNRWYERDHFLAGVLTGPGAFAGRRFVATRALKDLRFPETSPIARPVDDGSFIAVYWIEQDQLAAHCDWGFPEAARLAGLGRMNPNRHHVSTSYYDLVSVQGRGGQPVPAELAMHHPYQALVMVWTTTDDSGDSAAFAAAFGSALTDDDSPVGQVVSFRPYALPAPLPTMPGVAIGETIDGAVTAHACFVDAEVISNWPEIRGRIEAGADTDPATQIVLAAPFYPAVSGTDTHLDQLW